MRGNRAVLRGLLLIAVARVHAQDPAAALGPPDTILHGKWPTVTTLADQIASQHDPWYFRGEGRSEVMAFSEGINGSGVIVECNGRAPRVVMVFWADLAGYGTVDGITDVHPESLRLVFIKDSLISLLTARFDTQTTLTLTGTWVATSRAGLTAPSSAVIVYDGDSARQIVDRLKSDDRLEPHYAKPPMGLDLALAHFEMHKSTDPIDKVLKTCAAP